MNADRDWQTGAPDWIKEARGFPCVNSQTIGPSGANAGVGFAVSANTVRQVVPELIAQGRYPHPWLGVNFPSITPGVKQALQEAGITIPRKRASL